MFDDAIDIHNIKIYLAHDSCHDLINVADAAIQHLSFSCHISKCNIGPQQCVHLSYSVSVL